MDYVFKSSKKFNIGLGINITISFPAITTISIQVIL